MVGWSRKAGMSLCGSALGCVWMVTAGVGTGQWWMVASVRGGEDGGGSVQCRGGGRAGQCRPVSYRYQYLVIAAECGGPGLGITAASLTAPRRYFNGLYQVP